MNTSQLNENCVFTLRLLHITRHNYPSPGIPRMSAPTQDLRLHRHIVLHHGLIALRARQSRQDLADPADDLRRSERELASRGRRLALEALLRAALMERAADAEGTPAHAGRPGIRLGAEVLLDMLRVAVKLRKLELCLLSVV